jgi:ABC-2 type transport system permease protein
MSSSEPSAPARAAVRPRSFRRGSFARLYRSELRLMLTRRRNLALLAALVVIPLLIGVAVKVSNPEHGDGPPFLDRITGNGLFLVFTALTVSLPFFFPLVLGVVAGDAIAGEASIGTLRYLLTVPVSRTRLLAVKTCAVASFTVLSTVLMSAMALLSGAGLFGVHALVLLSGDTVGIGSALLRTLGVIVYVSVALFGFAAGGVLISTLTENPLAAMASTVSLAILSAILDAVPQLSAIHPALLTDHWLGFGELLRGTIDAAALVRWSLLHLAYAAVFLSLAWTRMVTKDVTS